MIRKEKYNLKEQNTFGMEVSCACFIEYDSVEELKSIDFDSLPKPIVSIGEGSNLLFTKDFSGTILRSKVSYIKYFDVGADSVPVAVGAGVKWDDFVAKACADGLWGAENLSLIPGTAGAAAVQNIGAYGAEAKDIIAGVTCFDLNTKEKVSFKTEALGYGYRDSVFKQPEFKGRYIITGVLFKLSRKPMPNVTYKGVAEALGGKAPESPQEVRDAIISIRRKKLPDPAEIGSAGSFFKNPVVSAACFAQIAAGYETVPHYVLDGGFIKIPAAWLIDNAGAKSFTRGQASLYANQPLVIVNNGGAAPEDVLALESDIINAVKAKFGIELSPEVEHL